MLFKQNRKNDLYHVPLMHERNPALKSFSAKRHEYVLGIHSLICAFAMT